MKKAIVLYDNSCNLCIGTIKFLEKADDHKQLLFIPLNSTEGIKYRSQYHINDRKIDSAILIRDNLLYTKSDVGILILKILQKHKLFYFLLRSFPKPIRDFVYDLITKHRHVFNKVTFV